jgi:hypothetical protein
MAGTDLGMSDELAFFALLWVFWKCDLREPLNFEELSSTIAHASRSALFNGTVLSTRTVRAVAISITAHAPRLRHVCRVCAAPFRADKRRQCS